jgi:hypothetical protein
MELDFISADIQTLLMGPYGYQWPTERGGCLGQTPHTPLVVINKASLNDSKFDVWCVVLAARIMGSIFTSEPINLYRRHFLKNFTSTKRAWQI